MVNFGNSTLSNTTNFYQLRCTNREEWKVFKQIWLTDGYSTNKKKRREKNFVHSLAHIWWLSFSVPLLLCFHLVLAYKHFSLNCAPMCVCTAQKTSERERRVSDIYRALFHIISIVSFAFILPFICSENVAFFCWSLMRIFMYYIGR